MYVCMCRFILNYLLHSYVRTYSAARLRIVQLDINIYVHYDVYQHVHSYMERAAVYHVV